MASRAPRTASSLFDDSFEHSVARHRRRLILCVYCIRSCGHAGKRHAPKEKTNWPEMPCSQCLMTCTVLDSSPTFDWPATLHVRSDPCRSMSSSMVRFDADQRLAVLAEATHARSSSKQRSKARSSFFSMSRLTPIAVVARESSFQVNQYMRRVSPSGVVNVCSNVLRGMSYIPFR